MSAKHGKKSAAKPPSASAASTPVPTMASAGAAAAASSDAPTASWLDSSDPRRRTIGKAVLIGVWIYVAALWLLALDQTFNWGIFGPKLPPIP